MAHLITDNDYVDFFRIPAWHGLGNVRQGEAATIDDMLKTIGYPIHKELLYTSFGEPTTTYATIRNTQDGRRIILGDKLSKDYEVLQNVDLIKAAMPLIEAGCQIETFGTLDEGRRVWWLLRLAGDLSVGDGDLIRRYILGSNEHTGKESARLGFVGTRVVCANTLGIAHESRQSSLLRMKHNKGIQLSLNQAVELIDTANGQFLAYGEQLEKLADSQISQADLDKYVKIVFLPQLDEQKAKAKTDKEKKIVEAGEAKLLKLQNVISELFQTEPSIIDYPATNGTAYGAYHAVNFWLNHVKPVGEEKRLEQLVWGQGSLDDARAMKQALALVK